MVVKGKSRRSRVGTNDGGTKCCFCHQDGLSPDKLPLNDEERENPAPEHKGRPKYYDFQYEMKYGQWFNDNRLDVIEGKSGHKENLSCHDRCLVSSPSLFVNHDDPKKDNYLPKKDIGNTLGNRGFPRDAILKEWRRSMKLNCCFCGKKGANIGCAIATCQKKFHYPCAIVSGYTCVIDNRTNPVFCIKHATSEFRKQISKGQKKYALNVQWNTKKEGKRDRIIGFGTENTETEDFKIINRIKELIETNEFPTDDDADIKEKCSLCGGGLWKDDYAEESKNEKKTEHEKFDALCEIIIPRCCQKPFHRSCVSRYGHSMGLPKVKCPTACGHQARFVKSVIAQGAFMPNREAVCEMEQEFDDQLAENRSKECQLGDACPFGSTNNIEGHTLQEVILCDDCGATGVHIGCDPKLAKLSEEEDKYDEKMILEQERRKAEGLELLKADEIKFKKVYTWTCDLCKEMLANSDENQPAADSAPDCESIPIADSTPAADSSPANIDGHDSNKQDDSRNMEDEAEELSDSLQKVEVKSPEKSSRKRKASAESDKPSKKIKNSPTQKNETSKKGNIQDYFKKKTK